MPDLFHGKHKDDHIHDNVGHGIANEELACLDAFGRNGEVPKSLDRITREDGN